MTSPPPSADFELRDQRASLTPEEQRVRRVPLADGCDPWQPAPLELAWHERSCTATAPGLFIVEIPYVGGPPPIGVDPALTSLLQSRWSERCGPWSITSATAAFEHTGPRRGVLRLALRATPAESGTAPLDGAAMAQDLQAALRWR